MNYMKLTYIFILLVCVGSEGKGEVVSFEIDCAKFNKPLMSILDSLYEVDQLSRYNYLEAIKKKADAARADSLLAIMRKQDLENLRAAKAIMLNTAG
jgi:hypothetical protein